MSDLLTCDRCGCRTESVKVEDCPTCGPVPLCFTCDAMHRIEREDEAKEAGDR